MPRDVEVALVKKFGTEDAQLIIENFGTFYGPEFRFSEASWAKIFKACKEVLAKVKK